MTACARLVALPSSCGVCAKPDFIKARIQTEIEVPRQGRAVDRVQCQKLLVRSLKDYLPVIQEQKRS